MFSCRGNGIEVKQVAKKNASSISEDGKDRKTDQKQLHTKKNNKSKKKIKKIPRCLPREA